MILEKIINEKKEKFQTWEHVTFTLIMIDYLISNADDPVIKIISVIYRLKMTSEKSKFEKFRFLKIQIHEISTF